MKQKYKQVKSSGYGKLSPPKPPRDRSREKERDILGYSRTIQDTVGPQDSSPTKVNIKDVSPQRRELKSTNNSKKAWSPAEVSKQKVTGELTLIHHAFL